MTTRRVAIYGGSFDPPHLGHVLSVAWALSAADVDAVWIIPTWKHAFDKEHGAAFDQRMSMCELAFDLFQDVQVSDIERRLGGVSRTLYTLHALESEHPDTVFRLLIGADVLPTTARWHQWDEVVKVAPPRSTSGFGVRLATRQTRTGRPAWRAILAAFVSIKATTP